MLFTQVVQDYLLWHYTRAFRQFLRVWTNLLWFIVHLFSIPQLAASLFSPFKRMTERHHRGESAEDFLGVFLINLLSRFIGAMIRSFLLIIGLSCLFSTIVIGVALYVTWVVLPIASLISFVIGVALLFV